jgi:hypothetical protein
MERERERERERGGEKGIVGDVRWSRDGDKGTRRHHAERQAHGYRSGFVFNWIFVP